MSDCTSGCLFIHLHDLRTQESLWDEYGDCWVSNSFGQYGNRSIHPECPELLIIGEESLKGGDWDLGSCSNFPYIAQHGAGDEYGGAEYLHDGRGNFSGACFDIDRQQYLLTLDEHGNPDVEDINCIKRHARLKHRILQIMKFRRGELVRRHHRRILQSRNRKMRC